ncbi:MAG: hypothetical protein ACFFDS_10660 [Candidatus Thorarchaeota archaeon]
MKKIDFLLIFTLTLSLLSVTSVYVYSDSSLKNQLYLNSGGIINTNLTVHLKFIGFDSNYVNQEEIELMLPDEYTRGYEEIGTSIFTFNYDFTFLDNTIKNQLEEYIRGVGTNGSGVGCSLNKTRLLENKITGDKTGVFIPEDGLIADAETVETYFKTNLYSEDSLNPGYTLFLLNLSTLDNADHSLEHWYSVKKIGYDNNKSNSYWYSDYNNIPDRTTLGWGGSERFCFLDLSARSWYFDWIINAWDFYLGDFLYYYYPDLDSFTQIHNPYTSAGNTKLSQYLSEWIYSYVGNLFSAYYAEDPIVESYSLQILIFDNMTNNGYTRNEIEWIISEQRIQNQLSEDFPWIEWDIEIQKTTLTDYPILFNYIADNGVVYLNIKFVEIYPEFYDILESQLGIHFDLDKSDGVLPCYFFLNYNVSFTWQGIAFAGLGGMGWEILSGNPNTIFEEGDPAKPRRGYSAVMIHELGHSLGFPHPHGSTYGWGSSFFKDTMNYFSIGEEAFSTFYQDGIARAYANYYFYCYLDYRETTLTLLNTTKHPPEYDDEAEEINVLLEEYQTEYKRMNYIASIALAKDALDRSIELINILTNMPTKKTSFFYLSFPAIFIFTIFRKKRKKNSL